MTMVQPPVIAETLKLKRIAIGEFGEHKDITSVLTNDVENILTSVRIQISRILTLCLRGKQPQPTTPTNGVEVKIRNITAVPKTVRTGDTIIISADFSVMAPKGTQNFDV